MGGNHRKTTVCIQDSRDHTTIRNTEIENTIIMQGNHIDCGRRITDSLIGRNVTILNHEQNLPRGHKLILGDKALINPYHSTPRNPCKQLPLTRKPHNHPSEAPHVNPITLKVLTTQTPSNETLLRNCPCMMQPYYSG